MPAIPEIHRLSGGPYRSVRVECYAGYCGEQQPRRYSLDAGEYRLVRVLGSWREEEAGSGVRRSCFLVVDEPGRRAVLFFDHERQEWFFDRVME